LLHENSYLVLRSSPKMSRMNAMLCSMQSYGRCAARVIERAVDYDDWFIREVEKGLAQVDAGQVLTHDAVGSRLDQKVAEQQSRR
jgi:predicted transcriptional regulator